MKKGLKITLCYISTGSHIESISFIFLNDFVSTKQNFTYTVLAAMTK